MPGGTSSAGAAPGLAFEVRGFGVILPLPLVDFPMPGEKNDRHSLRF